MSNENKENSTDKGAKIAIIIAVVVFVLWILWQVTLSIIPSMGGSFGYGFPSGSGGRAIRDVEIEVEPQVVYRIDDHRFFTFEKYVSCTSGGFVYYNDTNKKIKVFAGLEGLDKQPQDEFTISKQNDVLSFNGKFFYTASDNVIAYPTRDVDYKYGGSTYFVVYENIKEPSNNTGSGSILNDVIVVVKDDALYIRSSNVDSLVNKIKIPKKNSEDFEWERYSDALLKPTSQDDHFHCNNDIKPRRVKFIKN